MGMTRLRTTKIQHFAVAVDSRQLIFTTVMSEMTFHQPCLSMMWIYLQYSINKDFCDFPPFFGNCTRCVGPIDADL